MKLCVCGLGYIGLPTAAMFASQGIKVFGFDINEYAVDVINQGKIHIVEPGLDLVVKSAVERGNFHAYTKPTCADAYIICVPTPFKENNQPDLSYVDTVANEISPYLKKGDVVILESTSPVGTTERIAQIFETNCPQLKIANPKDEDCDVYVAYCPERVLPGKIMEELVYNDRVIGGINNVSAQKAAAIYSIFVKGVLLRTNARTAEMSKLTENSFRDVNIAFANELSLICDRLDIDVWELIALANHHPRVNILNPGPGVGGHCIAVDPWFIVSKTPDLAKLIATARNVNDGKPQWVINKVRKAVESLNSSVKKIACLGLSFKSDIDDLRESPAIKITADLADEFKDLVCAVEPNIHVLPELLQKKNVSLVTLEEGLKADVIVLLVDHHELKEITPRFRSDQVLIDTRGLWKKYLTL